MEIRSKYNAMSKFVMGLLLLSHAMVYSSEFNGLSEDERNFQGSECDFSQFGIAKFQRSREAANGLLKYPDSQYLLVLNSLSMRTINLLDMLDFKNIYDIKVNPELFNAQYAKLPEVEHVAIIEDSLNNPKFASEINAKDFSEEKRYVKCNINGISGWISNEIFDLAKKLQEPVDIDMDSTKQVVPFNNKVILHGPPGNGKTTLVDKMAEVSDAHLIKITGSSLHSKFVNNGAKKIRECFAQALHYAGSHKHKKVIIFIDEADSFARTDICAKEAHFLSTTQELWQCMDKVKFEQQVFVMLATNDYEKLHDTLTSRFNNNIIKINNPSTAVRKEIIDYYLNLFELNNLLLDNEIDDIVVQTEGMGIRDIELLFISAYEKNKSIKVKTDELLKKSKQTLSTIIQTRLDASKSELQKRAKNAAKKEYEEQIKELNLLALKRQIDAYDTAEFVTVCTILGGAVGGGIGFVNSGFTFKGARDGAMAGGGIAGSAGYLYYKGYLSRAYQYMNTNVTPTAKKIIRTLSFGMLLKDISSHMQTKSMIKAKL